MGYLNEDFDMVHQKRQAKIQQEKDAAILKKRIDAQKRAAAILALKASREQ